MKADILFAIRKLNKIVQEKKRQKRHISWAML